MTLLTALPLDILDQILSSLFDFASLKACVQTCSTLRRVYHDHPNSIRTSVATNLFGSRALVTAAWRVLLVERQLDEDSPAFQDDQEWIKSQLRSAASSEVAEITWPDAHALEECARICMDIEIIYSLNHKDKLTAETSRLSADESAAFCMALLRLWFFWNILSSSDSARDALEEFDARQDIIYSKLSNQELYELQLVIFWLDTEMESLDGTVDTFAGLAAIGLKGFLEAYTASSFDFLPDLEDLELDWMVEDDFEMLWQNRKVDPPRLPSGVDGDSEIPVSKGFKPLLSSRIGLDDACAKCDVVLGLNLYNCRNWANKRAIPFESTRDFADYFPGALRRNLCECRMFWSYLENPLSDCGRASRNDPFASGAADTTNSASTPPQAGTSTAPSTGWPLAKFDILEALFHLDKVIIDDNLQKRLAQDGYAHVEPDDWLCYPCLENLLRSRLWIWWNNQKASGRVIGAVLRENCWYGYECRTQTKAEHAQKLNHLCINTKPYDVFAKKYTQSRASPS